MNNPNFPEFIEHIADLAGVGDELQRELNAISNPEIVRRNCAFCGRERSRKDDNHAPECAYWIFFGAPS